MGLGGQRHRVRKHGRRRASWAGERVGLERACWAGGGTERREGADGSAPVLGCARVCVGWAVRAKVKGWCGLDRLGWLEPKIGFG